MYRHAFHHNGFMVIIAVGALAAGGGPAAAAVFTDSFDVSHDYRTGSVAGTIWDGVQGALEGGQPNNGTANIGAPGMLFWEPAMYTYWSGSSANGPMLFKLVAGDFDVSVRFGIGPSVYFGAGLI